jgi:hypothetical protein
VHHSRRFAFARKRRAAKLTPRPPCFSPFPAGHTSRHKGNVRHNELVLHGVIEWLSDRASDGPSWADTIDRIWTEIWVEGGRYVRWDASTGSWRELEEEAILKTIDQAMRSRLRWIRQLDNDHPANRVVADAIRANDFMRGRGGQ